MQWQCPWTTLQMLFVRLFVRPPARPPTNFDEFLKSLAPWLPSLSRIPPSPIAIIIATMNHRLPCRSRQYGHLSYSRIPSLIAPCPVLSGFFLTKKKPNSIAIIRPNAHGKYSPVNLVSAASWNRLTTGRLTSCRIMLRSPGPATATRQASQVNRLLLAESEQSPIMPGGWASGWMTFLRQRSTSSCSDTLSHILTVFKSNATGSLPAHDSGGRHTTDFALRLCRHARGQRHGGRRMVLTNPGRLKGPPKGVRRVH